jgi:hypothetical protein
MGRWWEWKVWCQQTGGSGAVLGTIMLLKERVTIMITVGNYTCNGRDYFFWCPNLEMSVNSKREWREGWETVSKGERQQ